METVNDKAKSVELVGSEVQEIQTRMGILTRLEAEIFEKKYFQDITRKDLQEYMKSLVKKHGLDTSKEYVFEKGVLRVDTEPVVPVETKPDNK